MTKFEQEMFAEALRDAFPTIEDDSFAYLLGALDGALSVTKTLEEIKIEVADVTR